MKRVWLGIVLLVFFLALGIFVEKGMERTQMAIARDLEEASQLVLAEKFAAGREQAQKAQAAWEKGWKTTASVADHTPMDEIDGLFAQLKAFEDPSEKVHYAATCAQLAQLVKAVAQAHRLTLENLL